ncbi:MAG TPA: hypothetical protein VIP77_04870 [Jiangellaceae bacterium]
MAQIDTLGNIDLTHKTTASIHDTHYLDSTHLTYQQLVGFLGQPDLTSGLDKSHCEWRITTPAGIATIYDWKQMTDPRETGARILWCIGGRDLAAAKWVLLAIHKGRQTTPDHRGEAMKLTGRTITVEEIGQVPELARAWRVDEYDLRIIERLDGVFVCAHSDGPSLNPVWDNARFLAERMEATYVGPGRQERLPASRVRVGWWVLAGPPRNPGWCRVEQVTEVVDLVKRETGPRPKIRIVVEGRAPITVRPAVPVECRPFVGA